MVPKFDDAAGLTFEHDDHAFSDLRCWNCHWLSESFSDLFRDATGENHDVITNHVV